MVLGQVGARGRRAGRASGRCSGPAELTTPPPCVLTAWATPSGVDTVRPRPGATRWRGTAAAGQGRHRAVGVRGVEGGHRARAGRRQRHGEVAAGRRRCCAYGVGDGCGDHHAVAHGQHPQRRLTRRAVGGPAGRRAGWSAERDCVSTVSAGCDPTWRGTGQEIGREPPGALGVRQVEVLGRRRPEQSRQRRRRPARSSRIMTSWPSTSASGTVVVQQVVAHVVVADGRLDPVPRAAARCPGRRSTTSRGRLRVRSEISWSLGERRCRPC